MGLEGWKLNFGIGFRSVVVNRPEQATVGEASGIMRLVAPEGRRGQGSSDLLWIESAGMAPPHNSWIAVGRGLELAFYKLSSSPWKVSQCHR